MLNKIPDGRTVDSGEQSQTELEKYFIDEYLKQKGLSDKDLRNLPEAETHRILIEASTYASGKFAEIESRERLNRNLNSRE